MFMCILTSNAVAAGLILLFWPGRGGLVSSLPCILFFSQNKEENMEGFVCSSICHKYGIFPIFALTWLCVAEETWSANVIELVLKMSFSGIDHYQMSCYTYGCGQKRF